MPGMLGIIRAMLGIKRRDTKQTGVTDAGLLERVKRR